MISRTQTIPPQEEKQVIESILRYTVTPDKSVEFVHCYGTEDTEGNFTQEPGTVKVTTFLGAEFAELMSANPSWAPLKPAGTFRAEDLFALLDFISSGGMNSE